MLWLILTANPEGEEMEFLQNFANSNIPRSLPWKWITRHLKQKTPGIKRVFFSHWVVDCYKNPKIIWCFSPDSFIYPYLVAEISIPSSQDFLYSLVMWLEFAALRGRWEVAANICQLRRRQDNEWWAWPVAAVHLMPSEPVTQHRELGQKMG